MPPTLQSFTVGAQFKGVKMLPPGPHLVAYNASSSGGDFAPTVSFFAHLAPRQVLVRRWHAGDELLLPLPDADEVCARGGSPCAHAAMLALCCAEAEALMHLRAKPAGGSAGGGGAAL